MEIFVVRYVLLLNKIIDLGLRELHAVPYLLCQAIEIKGNSRFQHSFSLQILREDDDPGSTSFVVRKMAQVPFM